MFALDKYIGEFFSYLCTENWHFLTKEKTREHAPSWGAFLCVFLSGYASTSVQGVLITRLFLYPYGTEVNHKQYKYSINIIIFIFHF